MGILYKIIDHTYFRFKRSLRKCAACSQKHNHKGKVNFGILFKQHHHKKSYYHESCLKDHLRNLKNYNAKVV